MSFFHVCPLDPFQWILRPSGQCSFGNKSTTQMILFSSNTFHCNVGWLRRVNTNRITVQETCARQTLGASWLFPRGKSTMNHSTSRLPQLRASKSCRHADARLRKIFQNMRTYLAKLQFMHRILLYFQEYLHTFRDLGILTYFQGFRDTYKKLGIQEYLHILGIF